MRTDRHQAILTAILLVLIDHAKRVGGWARPAGLRLRLSSGKFREPDVTFLSRTRSEKKGEDFWTGADLVAEVVSGSSEDQARDHVVKRSEYATAGVPEYWIIDPLMESVTVLVLNGAVYRVHGVFRRSDIATSATLEGVTFNVSGVLDAN